MSEPAAKKLSREEIAKIEIGHTDVSRPVQLILSGFFLFLIFLYPLVQCVCHSPFREWRRAETVQSAIKAYETSIEETSLLRKWLLSPVQYLVTGLFSLGNEKVIIGKNGWLFFSGDYEYLINPGFLRPEKLHKRLLTGVRPDPTEAITDFNRQLKQRGIRLILLPVPAKPAIYPDMLSAGRAAEPYRNSSWSDFLARMKAADVTVIDLTDDFARMRQQGCEPYLKTDTHWTPPGMKLAAERIAETLSVGPLPQKGSRATVRQTGIGDIAAMLKLPAGKVFFPPETVELTPVENGTDRASDILLLGDSFTNIYSLEAMNWGSRSGFAETLSARLGRPVDSLVRNDAGAYASRQMLAQELKRGSDRLRGKKVVIWEFAMRELATGDWKMIALPEVPASAPARGPAEQSAAVPADAVEAVVLAASTVPRPHSAPYKDHVMSLHLDLKNGKKVLVYTISMKDNVWLPAAKSRPGDTVRLRLLPWSEYEGRYGSWNRSELDDEELLVMEPLWGEFL